MAFVAKYINNEVTTNPVNAIAKYLAEGFKPLKVLWSGFALVRLTFRISCSQATLSDTIDVS